MRVTDEFVFFWGNQDVFSNFFYCPFIHDGNKFKWSEQAVMYRKAMLFGADDIAQEILEATSPMNCKSLGRSRDIPFNEKVWERNRENIYKEVLRDKFSYHYTRQSLLKTGDRVLVEASPYDKIWGIGMREDHQDIENPQKWKGLNLLGKVLMEIREELLEDE